ncbi:hypothetical protein LOY87_006434 [Ophidiomyces ophidiicola]|nr:hypothetical protein LOY87_006434 [Ophidiomyces ophidiicola]
MDLPPPTNFFRFRQASVQPKLSLTNESHGQREMGSPENVWSGNDTDNNTHTAQGGDNRLESIIQAQAKLIETHILKAQTTPASHERLSDVHSPSRLPASEHSCDLEHGPRIAPKHQEGSPEISVSQRVSTRSKYTPETRLLTPITEPSISQALPPRNPSADFPASRTRQLDDPRSDFAYHTPSLQLTTPLSPSQSQPLTNSDADLPPYDLLYALVDLYFEHINTWCPILHRRTTLDTLFGPSPLKEEDRMLLYAIVATTLRFSTDPRLNEDNRKRYYEISKQKVLIYGIYNSSVTALQALVVLSLDFVGSSHGPPGWKLLALIVRSVVQLGLAQESTSSLVANMFPSIYTLRANILPDPKTWIEEEGRRRLFWMVYLLDRYSTIATAFDFALDDKEIDRKVPCKTDYFLRDQPSETRWFETQSRTDYMNRRDHLGSFGFYIEVLGILSRIHLFLKRPVDIGALPDVEQWQSTYRTLDNELSIWEYHLPKAYSFDKSRLNVIPRGCKSAHCGWVMLHAAHQTTVIRLHSSAAYPTTRSSIFTPSYSASQRCRMAVENIRLLARFVLDNNLLDKLGPPFAFSLWVAARLLLVRGSTIAHTVDPEMNFFIDTLRRMGKYWKVAERYSTILQRVVDEFSEFEQSAGTATERITPSTVKILADMRRCAFDLDLLISRQPRHHPALSSPRTVLSPGRNLGQNELEYFDVFEFFNVPRVPIIPAPAPAIHSLNLASPDSQPPNSEGVPHMINADIAEGTAAAAMTNEFNITNYMVPTPETDWLFQVQRE